MLLAMIALDPWFLADCLAGALLMTWWEIRACDLHSPPR